jgi:AcrR family transcriptional regulator
VPVRKTAVLTSSHDRVRTAAKDLFAERGYEDSSTAEICRLAGTSQSQLVKHFNSKLGLLEAVFENAWEQINPAIRLAVQKIPSPTDKLRIVIDMVLTFLERDRALRTLFLLEGRRIRGDGHMVVLTPGFVEFIHFLDSILEEMAARGELSPDVHVQALRSGFMGAIEGMLRDQDLARTSHFPAAYSEADSRLIFSIFLSACLKK